MDLPKIRDLKDLQALLDLMQRNDLAELELEGEGVRIRLRKFESHLAAVPAERAAGVPAPQVAVPESPRAAAGEEARGLTTIKSPLVGTFYRAPSPEADPFVQEGDRVEPDTVLCIVEAMKVMNEIPAGVSGVVREIVARNGEPVEFGQPLFRIETE